MLKKLLLAAVAVVVVDQLVLHLALSDGVFMKHWVAPFDPPLFTDRQRGYLERVETALEAGQSLPFFDAELGWCPAPDSGADLYAYDWAGCRVGNGPLPRERSEGVRRVVTIGGSFTLGAEVSGPEAWPAILDLRPDLEVANLGVSGYGADQAFLRYQRDGSRLAPDEVWFGLLPRGTVRVTTHFPPISEQWSSVAAFKPVFLLGATGELELVPSPARTLADYPRLLGDQAALIDAIGASDTWVRRCPPAFRPRGSTWWHWFGVTRLILTWRENGGRDPVELLAPGGEPYRLLLALLTRLDAEVEQSGAELRVVVLPDRPNLDWVARNGPPYWNPLVDELAERGVTVLDTTAALEAAGARTDDAFWEPGGHYAHAANRVVAEAIEAAWLGQK